MSMIKDICEKAINLLKLLVDSKLHEELWDEIGPI